MRLLSPDLCGVLGMAALVTGFMGVLGNLGFGPVLVERRVLTNEDVTLVFGRASGSGTSCFLPRPLSDISRPYVLSDYKAKCVIGDA